MNLIAAQLGVEPTIAMIICALARKSTEQLLDAAQELGPKLGLDGALARSLMNLANSWNKESGRQGIKLFINTISGSTSDTRLFFDLNPATTPFTGQDDKTIDSTLAILPELAASMLAITEDHDFEPLVYLLNTEKVVRDAFKPVPMQVFALIQEVFEQDRGGVRHSLIRMLERLLISDACAIRMKGTDNPIPISRFVEHLSSKLNTDCQLAAVLAKIAVMQHDSIRGPSSGLPQRVERADAAAAARIGAYEHRMINALKGTWKPKDRDEIRRPIQSTKRWLRSKIVKEDGSLVLGRDGKMERSTENFVLVYQVLCLIDGISSIYMQTPDDLKTCTHFCNEIISVEPDIAGAILALINAEEGGVNPACSGSTQSMKERILIPLSRQLSMDIGVNSITDITIKKEGGMATSPALMQPQINEMLAATLSLTRGRRIDFTKLAVGAGLSRETALFIGPLLNGRLKAPLWKQVTPLCNALGLADSSCIVALIQLRRQADNNDFHISTDTLLPWLGVPPTALMVLFRWLIQLALAVRPAHVQRALVSTFNFNRSIESRKYSFIVARRRRLNVPLEGIWYMDATTDPDDVHRCMPSDEETVADERKDSELNEMNDWIALNSKIEIRDAKHLRLLTRHYEPVDEKEALSLETADAKEDFYDLVAELYEGDDEVDPALCSKVFDFITLMLTFGTDSPSLKATALVFKIKPDLLRTLMQVPLYSVDLPVRTLERPRASQRVEQAIGLLKDHLRIPADAAFKYNEMLSRACEDVKINDEALFRVCKQLDRYKESFTPRSWEFVQALTLPGNDAFDEFTSRALYAMLNLERDADDAMDFLVNAKVMDRVDLELQFPTPNARNGKWQQVRIAMRGLLAMCTLNMSQVIAFLHAADWIAPSNGSGLMMKLAICTTSGNSSHLVEHLALNSTDSSVRRVLVDLTSALTNDELNESERDDYALAFEAVAVLTIFRRSGDPQGTLITHFGRALRMVSECLEVHPALITALLSATTGDNAAYDNALLQLAQDDGGLTPQIAGGLCSIGSGDVKGIEELAKELDLEPELAEGLVALASGTPTTTRGCLPGFLATLEIDVDLGLGLLGLVNDDATSIAKLADALTHDRPHMRSAVYNTLVCLPGLRSNDRKRIVDALEGMSSNSKLTIQNMDDAADVAQLINTNTYAVRDAFGMLKLDLDLACLNATLFKFTTVPFATCDDSYEAPAYVWRHTMPGNYVRSLHGAPEQLGAEALFASLCSSKIPQLFQRVCVSLGMNEALPESKIRSDNEKASTQHIARPWNLQQTGHFLTGVFYTGVSGRFTRILEALNLEFDRKVTLQDLFEDDRSFEEILGDLGDDEEVLMLLDPSFTTKGNRRKSFKKYENANAIGSFDRKGAAQLVLKAIMTVPPQLALPNPHKEGSDEHSAYTVLQQHLRKKLVFDAKRSLKAVMLVYRMGAMSMSPPAISSRHSSKKKVELTLRWARFDPVNRYKYDVERPTRGNKRMRTFMSNVDWDMCRNSDTAANWGAYYLLQAEFNATVLMTYDDGRLDPTYELVSDVHAGGVYDDEHTNSIRFRHRQGTSASKADGGSSNATSSAKRAVQQFASLEQRLFESASLRKVDGSLEGSSSNKQENKKRAYAREARIDRVYKILEVADGITASSINTYGEDVGGMVLSLLWNDREKTGHYSQMGRTFQLLHIPANCGAVLVAITGREKHHPSLLPRFESTFSPEQSGFAPGNGEYRCEGDGWQGEDSGKPPRIKCDAAGIPEFKQRIPAELASLLKELNVPHSQREALYHLVRVSMGDIAFLNLNALSVSTKLGIPAQTCYGLCAGAYLQGADPHSSPDMTMIVRSLERLSADLGINEQLAGLIVAAAARNVASLRQLGIVLSTGMQPGQRRQIVNLTLVSKEALVRALCGLVTGEVAEQLLPTCRISKDGKELKTNIDLFCNQLLSKVFEQHDDLHKHANHLRCMAGLALADSSLIAARREALSDDTDAAPLYRLVPIDAQSGNVELDTLLEHKSRAYSIIEKFERKLMAPEQKSKAKRKYRGFFEGFLETVIRCRPNELDKLVHNGHVRLLTKESWLTYIVGKDLWDRKQDAEARSMVSQLSVSADVATARLAKNGTFSFLLFQIIKVFSGNNVPAKKQFGLVPLMEYLRPDGKGFKDGVQEVQGQDKYLGRKSKRRIVKQPMHSLPTMDIQPQDAPRIMSAWKLFQQMAANKLGRDGDSDLELRSFASILGACYNDGVATVSPAGWNAKRGELRNTDLGATKTITETYMGKTTKGTGVQIEVCANGAYKIKESGTGYGRNSVLKFKVGGKDHSVQVQATSDFALTKTAIECMLHIATGNWNSMHGIEPDLVKSQLEVDPPRAVKQTPHEPKHTPGWKLLRATNDRTLPQLVVGSDRRPLLALRRLRAFIKLGSGSSAISRVPPEKFKGGGMRTKCVSLSTEIFALLEGSSVAASYKLAILGSVFVLANDAEGLSGLWKAEPLLLSSVIQHLVKPSIDTASADAIVKMVRTSAKRELELLKQKNEEERLETAKQRGSISERGRGRAESLAGDSNISSDVAGKDTPSSATKADVKHVAWKMVNVMVAAVKKAFKFDVPNLQDASSVERRQRLSQLFDELQSYADLVEGTKTATQVMEKSFALVETKGTEIVAELLGDESDEGGEARGIVGALLSREESKKQFKTIVDAALGIFKKEFSTAHPEVMYAVGRVASTFLSGDIKSGTAIGKRLPSFPSVAEVGGLIASAGAALQLDCPELDVFAGTSFWGNVYTLFLQLRNQPQIGSAKDLQRWSDELVELLCKTCSMTRPGGLLNSVVEKLSPELRDDLLVKFARIAELRTSVAAQQGLMSVRERTTWYKEFSKQVLIGRYGTATAGTRAYRGERAFSKDQKMKVNEQGEHPLLGTAMYLFDMWSWVPDATDEKQLQQSVLRLRVLLKDAVQLAVELVANNSTAKKSRANPLRKREEQKRRIGFACTLIDVAFEIPRAVAGPCEDAWCHDTKRWEPKLTLDWERMAARIFEPCARILSALQRYTPRSAVVRIARRASYHNVSSCQGAAQLMESLRVLRNCKNSYGNVLALSIALDKIPLPQTADTAVDDMSSFVTLHGLSQPSGENTVAADADQESQVANIADTLDVMKCLAAYLKGNRIVIDMKADRLIDMSKALLGEVEALKGQADVDGDLDLGGDGDSGGAAAAAGEDSSRAEWHDAVFYFLSNMSKLLRLECSHIKKDADGNDDPDRTPLWHQLLTEPQLRLPWDIASATLKPILTHAEGEPKIASLGSFTETILNKFACPSYPVEAADADCVVSLALKYFPSVDAEVDTLLQELLVLKDIKLGKLLKFFANPLISLIPAMQVGTVALLKRLCDKEATAMAASIPQIAIALEICDAHEDSRPTLRMVANSIDKIMKYALGSDKSHGAMQLMLEEMVGDMVPEVARAHVTMPIIDALNGRQGLVALARSNIGTAAKSMRMVEMTKELAIVMGTKIFGVNEFIARRAVDVLEGCGGIQANTTHMRKLDTLSNERDLLQEAASVVVRTSRLNGIRTETSEYVLKLMRAIYRARWLENSANFEHFSLKLDNKGRLQGSMAARAKILLMTCRGTVSAQHGSLLRRVIEFVTAGFGWVEEKSDDVSGGDAVAASRGKGKAESSGTTLGHFNCPSCRRVNRSFDRVYGNEGVCQVCQELSVDVILSDCKHLVACSRCLLQMQDAAGAAENGGDAAASAANDGWVPPGFLYEIPDGNNDNVGFVHPAGIRRQLKHIYESYCKLLHPDVEEWGVPWKPWSEVSQDLSENPSDFVQLKKYVNKHKKIIGGNVTDLGEFLLLMEKSIGGGVIKTIRAMMTSTKSDKLVHIQPFLISLSLQTIAGVRLNRTTLISLMEAIAVFHVRDEKSGAELHGPNLVQIKSLVNDVCPNDGARNWHVYGTAENLVDFMMTNSKLKEHANLVFKVDDPAARKDPDCPTAEKAINLARISLMRCLKGVHTGRDYAVNLIFPLVRLMHFRYGLYGNIRLLANLTVRDLIKKEVETKEESAQTRIHKEDDDSDDDEQQDLAVDDDGGNSKTAEQLLEEKHLRQIGSFPVFDMFGDHSDQAEDLIHAANATLFRKHDDERGLENAERIGRFMSSLVQVHQRLYQCINKAESENDDVESMKMFLFTPEHGAESSPLIDKPLMTALDMVSEITMDHPKRVLIALIKVCGHIEDQARPTSGDTVKPPPQRLHTLASAKMSEMRALFAVFVEEPKGKDFVKIGKDKLDGTGNILNQRWKVTLSSTPKLQDLLGTSEKLTVTTEVDAKWDDADTNHSDEWAVPVDCAAHESLTPENTQRQGACQSVALVRAWSKLLCYLLKVVWKKATQVHSSGDQLSDQAYVERGMNQRLECARQMVHMLVLESATDVIDEFDTAVEGLRVKRLVIAYYRSILCYLGWYMGLRKLKYPWLKKLVYQMPVEARSTDEFFSLPKTGQMRAIPFCFWGQFGILQYCRRVAHIVFNCRTSGIQRTDFTSIVQKLFELQRAFDVDLTDGRMWVAPEALRPSLAERVELTDCFAINVLYTVGPLRPLIDCIYLNRKLLTGTGLQSPVAFQERYEHLADEQVSMYLRLVDRVNPALTPHVDGQVAVVARRRNGTNDDAISMSASLLEEFDATDGLSVIFGAGNQRQNGIAGADTISIGSKGSAGSVRSTAGESTATAKKNHPVMAFIPVASKLFIALARAKQGIFTWDLYEKMVRTIVMESVLKASGCNLESPFSNLPLQPQLRKILESTLEMAAAENRGGESRESALKLSGMMGRLLGLEDHLVEGMLAVVNKSPQGRQQALGNLGIFLAKSITPATVGVGGGVSSNGGGGGGSGGGGLAGNASMQVTKGDSSMQISATISGLVALASNDFEGARQMAVKLGGFDVPRITRLFAFCSAMHKAGMRGDEVATRTARDPVASVEGVLSDEKLYIAFDTSGNANMDYHEFETVSDVKIILMHNGPFRLPARAPQDI